MRTPYSNVIRILISAWVIAILSTTQAWAVDIASARTFLQGVYKRYSTNDKNVATLGKDAPNLFAQELLTLIREDQSIAQGEVGLLDHDPICSCQDWEELTVTAINIIPQKARRLKAKVTFVNGGKTVVVRLLLVQQSDNWRILDIEEAHIPSLYRFLKSGLSKE